MANDHKEKEPQSPAAESAAPSSTPPPDNTNPDEKALADKLMQELKASGVNVDAMATKAKDAAPTEEKKPEPESKKEIPPEVAPVPTPPLADPETEQITNEALVEMIDEKIQKISGDDFLVIKLSKPGLLVVAGVILLLVWIIPFVSQIKLPSFSKDNLPFVSKQTQEVLTPTPTPSPTPVSQSTIRIRMGSNSLEAASSLKQTLESQGFKQIDIVYDPQVNPNVLLVASREEATQLKQQLVSLLEKDYKVASESATLTSDSDFVATLLVGKNSLRK